MEVNERGDKKSPLLYKPSFDDIIPFTIINAKKRNGMSEKNEKKEITKKQNEETILDEYLKPRRLQPKFWRMVILSVIFVLLVFIYKITVIDPTINPEELKASMEIFNINSQWVVSEKVDTPDFKGIVLVPQFSFQVRNIGKVNLRYVFFLGVFRLLNRAKPLGEGFNMALKKNLEPGKESERIVLTSRFGYRASSKQAFNKYSREWRSAMVQIFVKTGASKLFFLKSYYISRKIEGLEIDIKITDKPAADIM